MTEFNRSVGVIGFPDLVLHPAALHVLICAFVGFHFFSPSLAILTRTHCCIWRYTSSTYGAYPSLHCRYFIRFCGSCSSNCILSHVYTVKLCLLYTFSLEAIYNHDSSPLRSTPLSSHVLLFRSASSNSLHRIHPGLSIRSSPNRFIRF